MNPWNGINAWKSFRYDARHPGQLVRRAIEGQGVPEEYRWIFQALVIVGLIEVGQALVVLGLHYSGVQ